MRAQMNHEFHEVHESARRFVGFVKFVVWKEAA
jgi:hypothetical protein